MKQKHANFWASSCLKKKKLQLEWAERIVKQAKSEGNFLRIYLCNECLKYHVTSKPLKEAKVAEPKWIEVHKKTPPLGVQVKVQTFAYKFTQASFNGNAWTDKFGKIVNGVMFWEEV